MIIATDRSVLGRELQIARRWKRPAAFTRSAGDLKRTGAVRIKSRRNRPASVPMMKHWLPCHARNCQPIWPVWPSRSDPSCWRNCWRLTWNCVRRWSGSNRRRRITSICFPMTRV